MIFSTQYRTPGYEHWLLHEAGIHDLDQWLSDFAACDSRYLMHFYRTGEKRAFRSFWRDGAEVLIRLHDAACRFAFAGRRVHVKREVVGAGQEVLLDAPPAPRLEAAAAQDEIDAVRDDPVQHAVRNGELGPEHQRLRLRARGRSARLLRRDIRGRTDHVGLRREHAGLCRGDRIASHRRAQCIKRPARSRSPTPTARPWRRPTSPSTSPSCRRAPGCSRPVSDPARCR